MNLTLVLTGLATFGSIGFYGMCEQSADECNAQECPADQQWLSVRIGPNERRPSDTSDREDSTESRTTSSLVDVLALP
ncbi:MAG TPA: hypothetical protein VGB18_04145 [Candidatus Thermoplasmatota archaeon]